MKHCSITWELSELKNVKHLCARDMISSDNINWFLRTIISNASARTNIPVDDIIAYNHEFYSYFEQVFSKEKIISGKSDEFKKLCSLFKIPILKKTLRSEEEMVLTERKEESTHIDCLELFNTLSTEEKIKFVIAFQSAEIKLSPAEILKFKSF